MSSVKETVLNVIGKNQTISCVVTHVPFAGGLPQKKGINPTNVQHPEIKYIANKYFVHVWSDVHSLGIVMETSRMF